MSQLSRSTQAGPRPLPSVSRHTLALVIAGILAALLALPSVALAAPLIVIDAGHGGIYNHARYGKLKEKTVNLWLALELARQLSAQGYAVRLTRTVDTAVTTADIPTWGYSSATGMWSYRKDGRRYGATPYDDLQARVDAANAAGADLFISLHNNGSGRRSAHGTETWAGPNDPQGIALGRLVQRAVVSRTKLRNRGAFQTDFYVLKWSNMPAVLVEGAFLTNRAEARKLANATFRRKLVGGIVLGVNRWFATAPLRRIFTRIEGASAADVAASASAVGWPSGAPAVLLTSATDYSRALACAPLSREMSAPVLLADAVGVPASTLTELARLKPAKLLVLATTAAVPDAVVTAAAVAAGSPAVERVSGADPAEASTIMAERLIASSDATVVLAPASAYADVISAAAYAAARQLPLVLTEPGDELSPAAAAFFSIHSADMTSTVVFGAADLVTDSALSGLPNIARIAGSDMFQTNALGLRAAYPWPARVHAFVVSPTGSDALVASALAANTPGGVPLFNAGRVLSPWSREWVSNMRGRTNGFTIVGGEASQPALVDVMLDKARH